MDGGFAKRYSLPSFEGATSKVFVTVNNFANLLDRRIQPTQEGLATRNESLCWRLGEPSFVDQICCSTQGTSRSCRLRSKTARDIIAADSVPFVSCVSSCFFSRLPASRVYPSPGLALRHLPTYRVLTHWLFTTPSLPTRPITHIGTTCSVRHQPLQFTETT